MESNMLPPIEALSRNFILPQHQSENTNEQGTITEKFHGLVVGELALLLESDSLALEILDSLPLCRLPNAPPWLHAMANQRGNIIPIFDLSILFEQVVPRPKQTHYLVIAQDQDQFGIIIDQLPEKLKFQTHDFIDSKPVLPANLVPYVNRTCNKHGRTWLEWNPVGFVEAISDY